MRELIKIDPYTRTLCVFLFLSFVTSGCAVELNNPFKKNTTSSAASADPASTPTTSAPTLDSVSPTHGSTAGSTLVTLTGTNFSSTTTYTISFGGSACTSPSALSSTTLTCLSGAHTAGIVDITLTDSFSRTTTLSSGFTYVAAPSTPSSLTLVAPTSSPGNNPSPTIRVNGVTSGNVVAIYTSNTCNPASLKGYVTASSSSADISVSSALTDGVYTFYANQTDSFGNVSNCSSGLAYSLDTVPPTISITAPTNGGYANLSNYTNFNIRGTCSENGRQVVVAVTDGTTTIHPATQPTCNTSASPQWSTTVNLTTLGNSITIAASIVDAAGNMATSTPVSITKDITAPTITSVVVQSNLSVDVTFSEAMQSGITTASYYTLSGTGQGSLSDHPTSVSLVSGNTYRLTWSSGVMKNGGDITIAVATAQDLAGNPIASSGTATGGATATLPTTPSGISLVAPATSPGNDITPTLQVNGVTSGNKVYLFNSATCGGTALVSGTAASSNLQLTTPNLTNGTTYTFSALQEDAAGNRSACSSGTVSYTVDTTPPTVSITTPSNGGYANLSNYQNYTVSGTCSETGRTVTLSAVSGGTTIHPATQPTCNTGASPNWSATLDLSSLGTSIALSAVHADAAGNSATSATITITKDITPPTVSTVAVHSNLSVDVTFSEAMGSGVTNAAYYTISGTGKGTLNDSPTSVALVSGNTYRLTWSAGIMKSGGDITISVASAGDLAGNPITSSGTATGGATATLPSAPSTLTLNTPASSPGNNPTPIIQVSGVTSGNSVSIYTDSSCTIPALKGSATAAGTSVLITSSLLTNGSYTFYASQTDAAENVSACSIASVTYALVTSGPTIVITTPANNGYANLSNYQNYDVHGICSENGREVTLSATDGTTTIYPATQPTCNTSANPMWNTTLDLSTLGTNITLTATHTDAATNTSTSSPVGITKDLTRPTVSTVTVYSGTQVDVTFSELMGTGATTVANFTLSGTGKGTLSSNPTSITLVSGNTYRLTWGSGIMKSGGDITIAVTTAQDKAGNSISGSSSATATGGGTATAPSSPTGLTLITPSSSPGNNSTPTIRVSGVSSGNSVALYTSSSCNVPSLLASATASGSTVDITTSALTEGTYTLYAAQTDAAGNTSSCSTASVTYILDTTPPTVSITTPANNTYANLSNYTSFTISGSCSENGRTVTVSATDGTTTVYPATQPTCNTSATPRWSTAIDLSSLGANITLKAVHVDAAGNSTTSGLITITKDVTAPAPTITSPAAGSFIYSGGTTSVTFSGACTENTATVSFTVSGGSSVNASTTCNTGATPQWAVTVNVTGLLDGALSASVSQTDVAGNVGTSPTVIINKDTTPPTITRDTSTRDQLYPLTATYPPVTPGTKVTISATATDPVVNSITADSSFSDCTVQSIGLSTSDPNYIAANSGCSVLPSVINSDTPSGAASWSAGSKGASTTATLIWYPKSTQRGTYQFTFTATDDHQTSTQNTYITVRDPFTSTNLLSALDTITSDVGSSSPLTSILSIPRMTTPTNNNNVTSGWRSLTDTNHAVLTGFTTTAPWQGTGQTSNPYALKFNGTSDDFTLGSVLNTSTATTRFAVSTWVKPAAASTAGSVIASNGGVTGNGFTLRQSVYPTSRAELIVGKKYYSYADLVLNDKPYSYWRFSETSGGTINDSGAYKMPATATGTYSRNQGGALTTSGDSDPSIYLNGAAGSYVYAANSFNTPNTFTLEAWFKTTTTTGGKIIGFGNAQTGESSSYDRHIYMTNSGQLIFGVYTGSYMTVTASGTYRDGAWHHVVATLSSAGMKLYVDGALRVTPNTSVTSGNTYTGFLRVGYDGLGNWPSTPSTYEFKGNIDEVAMYRYALSDTQIADHYYTGSSGNRVSYPANAILADSPVGYWRLDEKSGTTAYDMTTNSNHGTYTGTITQGQTGALSKDSDSAALFDGSSGYISIPDSTSLSITGDGSIESWVYISNALPASDVTIAAVGSDSTTTAGWGLQLLYNKSLNILQTCTVVNSQRYCMPSAAGSAPNVNMWYHLVGTRAAGMLRLYVNGTNSNYTSVPTTAMRHANPSFIGALKDSNGMYGFFGGKIDEVAFYNYPLSATQVTNHYNAGNGAGWWICQSQTQLNNSNWNFLEGLFDGTNAKLFINGLQECSIQPGLTYSGSVASTAIGASTSASNFWSGLMATLNIFGTSDNSTNPASATTASNDFAAGANRFRSTPVETIVTNGLVFHIDAANAKQGTMAYSNGCAASDLTWFDLTGTTNPGLLNGFSSCSASNGWYNSGSSSGPFYLAFDGATDFVQFDHQPALQTASFTIDTWIRPSSSTPSNSKNLRVIEKGGNFNKTNYSIEFNSDGLYRIKACVWSTQCTGVTSPNPLPLNAWTHVAVTYQSSTLKIYINGTNTGSTTSDTNNSAPMITDSSTISVGKAFGASGNYFNGGIGALRIYNRQLNTAEVKQNCNAQKSRYGASCEAP